MFALRRVRGLDQSITSKLDKGVYRLWKNILSAEDKNVKE